MVLYLKENGTLEVYNASGIHQGAVNVRADVLSTLNPEGAISISFVLPNGQKTVEMTMSNTGIGDSGFSLWTYTMPATVMQYAGTLSVQVRYTIGGVTTASTLAQFSIGKGTAAFIPSVSPSDWNAVLAAYNAIVAHALKAEGYAVGEQNGTPVQSGTYFNNNAKYYSQQASASATEAAMHELYAEQWADSAALFADNAEESATNAGNSATAASNSASAANTSAGNAAQSATNAGNKALVSEGYAVGKQNGEDVEEGSPYYHNNAKYYAEHVSASIPDNSIEEVKLVDALKNKINGKADSSAVESALAAKANTADVNTALATKQDKKPDGTNDLIQDGKIAMRYIPDALIGQVSFQSTWNASTGVPTETFPTAPKKGYYWICQSAGGSKTPDGASSAFTFEVGDWALILSIEGSTITWTKIDNTDAVTMVNGKVGAVVAKASGIGTPTALTYADGKATVTAPFKTRDADGNDSEVSGTYELPISASGGLSLDKVTDENRIDVHPDMTGAVAGQWAKASANGLVFGDVEIVDIISSPSTIYYTDYAKLTASDLNFVRYNNIACFYVRTIGSTVREYKGTGFASASRCVQYTVQVGTDRIAVVAETDILPTAVNDRYLHTNASTGALEWSEVDAGLSNAESVTVSILGGTLSAEELEKINASNLNYLLCSYIPCRFAYISQLDSISKVYVGVGNFLATVQFSISVNPTTGVYTVSKTTIVPSAVSHFGKYLHLNSSTGAVEWSDVDIPTGVVKYDEAQTLTSEQKAQARTNIGAISGITVTIWDDDE